MLYLLLYQIEFFKFNLTKTFNSLTTWNYEYYRDSSHVIKNVKYIVWLVFQWKQLD